MIPNIINRDDVVAYIEQHIGDFHQARLKSLTNLKLDKILKRKNPYLFKAKNVVVASDLVRLLLEAQLTFYKIGTQLGKQLANQKNEGLF
jgi:hypothetical protein